MTKVNTKKRKPATPPAQPEPKKSADRMTKERIEQLQIVTSQLSKQFEELLRFQKESRAETHAEYEKLFQMIVKKTHDINNNFQNQAPEPKKLLTRDEIRANIVEMFQMRNCEEHFSTAGKIKVLKSAINQILRYDKSEINHLKSTIASETARLSEIEARHKTIKEIFDL